MSKKGKFHQGIYQIINNDKYVGKRPVVYRSNWEKDFCNFCDKNPNIVEWASESMTIPYFNPIKGTMSRYYPDFMISYLDRDGNKIIEVIEVKPYRQTIPPKGGRGKKKTTLLQEHKTYAVNDAKWKAATDFCKERGMIFRIVTERDIYGK